MFNTKNKNLLGFTLVEMMISLFLSVMVAFFVYTMMISSYNAYNRLSSLSKNANSIRFFLKSIENSIKYSVAFNPPGTPANELVFERYTTNPVNPTGPKIRIRERYYFDTGAASGTIVRDSTNSANGVLSTNSYYKNALGLLKKDVIIVSENRRIETVVISNVIRTIYYFDNNISTTRKYRTFNLGVIYDDVVNGRQNNSGNIVSGNGTEMSGDTINRRQFCFFNRNMV
jgi:Tfp pilus assembly protein PilW